MLNRHYNTDGKTLVPSDDGKRIIGVIADSTFTKSNWRSSRCLCRRYNAVGIDKGSLHNHILPFATLIVVPDRDTDKTYHISVDKFRCYSIEDDLGWGVQVFCPLSQFEILQPNPKRPRQLSFFTVGGK